MIIVFEPHHVRFFLKTSCTVQLFEFLTFDILQIIGYLGHLLLDIFTF